jgi:hypothetical protein
VTSSTEPRAVAQVVLARVRVIVRVPLQSTIVPGVSGGLGAWQSMWSKYAVLVDVSTAQLNPCHVPPPTSDNSEVPMGTNVLYGLQIRSKSLAVGLVSDSYVTYETGAFQTDAFQTDTFQTDTFETDTFQTDTFETDTSGERAGERTGSGAYETDTFETDTFQTDAFQTDTFQTGTSGERADCGVNTVYVVEPTLFPSWLREKQKQDSKLRHTGGRTDEWDEQDLVLAEHEALSALVWGQSEADSFLNALGVWDAPDGRPAFAVSDDTLKEPTVWLTWHAEHKSDREAELAVETALREAAKMRKDFVKRVYQSNAEEVSKHVCILCSWVVGYLCVTYIHCVSA